MPTAGSDGRLRGVFSAVAKPPLGRLSPALHRAFPFAPHSAMIANLSKPWGSLVSSTANPAAEPRTELTLRGVILGVIITLLFTAANVFFGLKAGLTFATSIPAA